MKSYEWRADKEVTPLDPVPDVFLKLNSSFYGKRLKKPKKNVYCLMFESFR